MSEYQYYEFRAIDRSLTKEEMAQVRALSTRATITPSPFVNVYHWGDFRGEPRELMLLYYDAHVYTANWGTHQLMFAFPQRLLDPAVAARYCVTHGTSPRQGQPRGAGSDLQPRGWRVGGRRRRLA
jgi:hypothetical protein